jgi:hypothetical protein
MMKTTEHTERILNEFVEEVWDAVCRLRVGSGLTNAQVRRALREVEMLVKLTETVDEDE